MQAEPLIRLARMGWSKSRRKLLREPRTRQHGRSPRITVEGWRSKTRAERLGLPEGPFCCTSTSFQAWRLLPARGPLPSQGVAVQGGERPDMQGQKNMQKNWDAAM